MTAAHNQLPRNMRAKIVVELCPVAGLPGDCWAWTGALNSKGYGCVGVYRKSQLAHRVAYEITFGLIPAGLQIDHLCGNKRCCNPAHLEAVTGKTNMERTDQARKTHCVNGHRLAGANLIFKKAGQYTIRNCRECQNARNRAFRAARREALLNAEAAS